MSKESSAGSASTDQPIKSSKQDLLLRTPFAQLVADTLLEVNLDHANVVAVMGGWGSGKTSVAELALESVGNKATVLRFDPWMVADDGSIVREFLTTFARSVFNSDTAEARKSRARMLTYASKILGITETTANVTSLMIPGFSYAKQAAKGLKSVTELAAQGLETRAQEPSLRELKEQVSSDLRNKKNVKKPILVVIDDIDRLDHGEVRVILQLIKAIADFPNVSYLLLFDRYQVTGALQDTYYAPDQFLEKIITHPFDLPESTKDQRIQILDDVLSDLKVHENLPKEDMERLSRAFHSVLLPGLPTLRHIKRYARTIKAILPSLTEGSYLNVDPADFLLLEFIRQYAPGVYDAIRTWASPRAGGKLSLMLRAMREETKNVPEAKEFIDPASGKLSVEQKKLVDPAIEQLEILEDDSNDRRTFISKKRFSTEFWRPVYLGFSSARAGITESKWKEFLVSLDTFEAHKPWLEEWSDRKLRDRWLTLILGRVLDIKPWNRNLNLISALLDWGDQQSPEEGTFLGQHSSWEYCVHWIIESIMEEIPLELSAATEMTKALHQSKSIIAAAYVIGHEAERRRKNDYKAWSKEDRDTEFIRIVTERFQPLVETGEIWDVTDVGTAFSAIHYLLGEDSWREFYGSIHKNPESVRKYLENHIAKLEYFNYGFEEGDLVKSIRDLDVNLLSEDGKKARNQVLNSVTNNENRRLRHRRSLSDMEIS